MVCRALDIVLAAALAIFVCPIMILTAVAIMVQDGGPALYGQPRIGRNGRVFKCWKFRTMVMDADARLQHLLRTDSAARAEWEESHKIRRDPRITPIGRFLRVSSLDELPQLLNVLAGDMSLVGPRPIVEAEIPRYGRWFRHYCAVMPGITGLWQVSGRSDVDYRRRVALDVLFARSPRLTTYFRILSVTLPAVLGRRGSY